MATALKARVHRANGVVVGPGSYRKNNAEAFYLMLRRRTPTKENWIPIALKNIPYCEYIFLKNLYLNLQRVSERIKTYRSAMCPNRLFG